MEPQNYDKNEETQVKVKKQIPDKYKPITAWGYFGYELLFAIPIIGFIILVVFAVGGTTNVNLRNFARSYFCAWIVVLIAIVIFLFAMLLLVASTAN